MKVYQVVSNWSATKGDVFKYSNVEHENGITSVGLYASSELAEKRIRQFESSGESTLVSDICSGQGSSFTRCVILHEGSEVQTIIFTIIERNVIEELD